MFSKINSLGIHGVEGFPVTVEADVSDGLPGFIMVGYLSEAVKEAQDRVRMALKNSGFYLPPKKVMVNLSPGDIRKEGTAYDLAIAAAVLCSLGEVPQEGFEQAALIGELGLDGSIKPVRGVLSRVFAASKLGIRRFFVPEENVSEGTAVKGMEIVGVGNLRKLAGILNGTELSCGRFFDESLFQESNSISYPVDYEELTGLTTVRRACQAAAAGRHNILLIGPAGTGKTMAARRLPTIMPPISMEESIEVSKIYSICGMLKKEQPLIRTRPFRSPHHSITAQALAGGGRNPRPGEVSLATHGILFLDELPEFTPALLDLLRQPMEERKITVSRMNGSVEFPADTMIAAAMNPCKCGFYPDVGRCTCTEPQIRRYLSRISGPFLDRIDIGVEVPRQPQEFPGSRKKGESSAVMRERVMAARMIQEERFKGENCRFNSQMERRQTERYCGLKKADERFLGEIYRTYGLSARAYEKILKTARTLADLDEKKQITREHLSEAVSFRSFEKKYWGFKF